MLRFIGSALVALILLTGCTATPEATAPADPWSVAASANSGGVVPEPGDCLVETDDRIDWTSSMPCQRNHRYDVVSIDTWPGMQDAITETDAATLYRDLTERPERAAEYLEWADRNCLDRVRETVGWGELRSVQELAGFEPLPSAPWAVETSIAGLDDFVDGEHRTVCSVAWWETLRYPDDVSLGDFFSPSFPRLTRNCWADADDFSVSFTLCDREHIGQSFATIDLMSAYGVDEVVPFGELPDVIRGEIFDACTALAVDVVPSLDPETHYSWSMTLNGGVWDDLESAPAHPGARYDVECVISRLDEAPVRGDIFDGTVEVVAG